MGWMTAGLKSLKFLSLLALVLLAGPITVALGGLATLGADWRTANRDSAGIAPDPARVLEPIVQVYGARAFGWRGAFAVHTWISVKRRGAPSFTTYQVIGWRHWQGMPGLIGREEPPD
ncbi:MAG: DUF3750 domain-containing protein, partial [Kiloniellales bacterium]